MNNRIKEIREKTLIKKTKEVNRPMSQEELSEKSGVSRATISKLESGEDCEVKVGTIKKIAQALNVEVSDLLV